jgi:hypothetical protein
LDKNACLRALIIRILEVNVELHLTIEIELKFRKKVVYNATDFSNAFYL